MQLKKKKTAKDRTRDFVFWWSQTFPLDVWYRDRFQLKFNSKEHRRVDLFDMMFEFEEILSSVRSRNNQAKVKSGLSTYDKTGRWLKEAKFDKVDIDKAFDDLDLSKF